MRYKIVEKKEPNFVHGYFNSKESAERHLSQTIPEYVKLGYYMDKTLKAGDFVIKEAR